MYVEQLAVQQMFATSINHRNRRLYQRIKETLSLYLCEFSFFLDASVNSNLPFLVGFRN